MNEKEREFREFYNKNFKLIFNYIKQRVPIYEDSEEIALETFSAIWTNWSNIDDTKNVKALLFKICSNKLNDFLRKKYSLNYEHSDLSEIEESIEVKEVESRSEKVELIEKLNNLVSKLTEIEQKVFELKYKNNLSSAQIAKELNITINNAKVINNRLLKKLKNLWEKNQK